MLGYLFLAAAVGTTVYIVTRKSAKVTTVPAAQKRSARGARRWCVIGYNYPKSHRDRREKYGAGPYDTKARASEIARRQKGIWYTEVRRCRPQDL